MLSCNDQNKGLIFERFRGLLDGEDIYFVPPDGGDQVFFLQKLFFVFDLEETVNVAIEVGESVGVAVCHQQYIFIMRRRYLKSQGVVVASGIFYLMAVFEVADVFSSSRPSLLGLLAFLHGVNAGHKSVVEEGVCFSAVDDVDGECFVFGRVDDPEVKPLCVSLGVEVVLQKQIVLPLVYLYKTLTTLYTLWRLPDSNSESKPHLTSGISSISKGLSGV